MFLRFVVGADGEDHRQLTGVIAEARLLRDDGLLYDYEDAWLQAQFDWFNANVPVPPYSKSKWPDQCAAWFKNTTTAADAIGRMWEFVQLLRENGKNVRILSSKLPGFVWYEDDFQVVVTEYR